MKYAVRIFLFLVLSIGFFGCDDIDLEGEEAGEVRGLWQRLITEGNNDLVLISDTEFNFYKYDAQKNCVETDAYNVIMVDGTGFFQVEKGDGSPEKVFAVSKNGDRIHLRPIDSPQEDIDRYWASEIDINSIPECLKETDIQGLWENTTDDELVVLDITTDSVRVIARFVEENCFERTDLRIEGRNGNIYNLVDQITPDISGNIFVEIKRTETGLEVTREEDGVFINELYLESQIDVASLTPLCSQTIPADALGLWDNTVNTATTSSHVLVEELQVTYYTFSSSSCYEKQEFDLISRRGPSYFFTEVGNTTNSLVLDILNDSNQLILRSESNEDRYTVSKTTVASIDAGICTVDP